MNPFSFLLALNMMLLSSYPNADKNLALTRNLLENLSQSLSSMQNGILTMHTGMESFRNNLMGLQYPQDNQIKISQDDNQTETLEI